MSAACSHADAHIGQRVCRHLYIGEADSYAHRFTGEELEYDLVCPACAAAPEEADMVTVCAECFDAAAESADWSSGVASEPDVAERSTQLSFSHQMVRLSVGLGASLLDLQARPGSASSTWLAITSAGNLVSLDLEARTWKAVAELGGALDLERDVSLLVSPDGKMAAAVEVGGSNGVVVDVATGEITMILERGTAQEVEGARFPVAFAQVGGRLVLIHATEWNRLDAFDPRTGALLTQRPLADAAAHTVPYASSQLAASPDGEWLLDNGFSAEGAGMPAIFRLRPWLSENSWEADDGGSRRYLCQRWDFWDGPLCWIDGRTVAIWGYGPDRESLIPAVVLYDVTTGQPLRWFPGPRGPLIFDEHLFALGDGDGISVWDTASGERLLHDAGFHPLRYHPGTRQFLTTNPDGELFVLSRLVGDPNPP